MLSGIFRVLGLLFGSAETNEKNAKTSGTHQAVLKSTLSIASALSAETNEKNTKIFETLIKQGSCIHHLVSLIDSSSELDEEIQISLHHVHQALRDALDVVHKYGDQGWLRKWLFADRMQDEVNHVYTELCNSAANLVIAMKPSKGQSQGSNMDPAQSSRSSPASDVPDEGIPDYSSRASEPSLQVGSADMPDATVQILDLEQYLVNERKGRFAFADANTPLSKARAGKFKEMYTLLEQGTGNANDHGTSFSLLHQAVFWESRFAVAILINKGADVNVKTLKTDEKLQLARGSTPLHIAALLGNEHLVRLLLCSGANRNATDDDGNTPAKLEISPQCKQLITSGQITEQAREMCTAASEHRFGDTLGLKIHNQLPLDIKTGLGPTGSDYYIIHWVAHAGDLHSYRRMLAHGACPLLRAVGQNGSCMLPSDIALGHMRNDPAHSHKWEELVSCMQAEEQKALERL